MIDLDDRDREILERFRTYWEASRDPDTVRRCERMVKVGLMERKKQARRGFPTMYRTVE